MASVDTYDYHDASAPWSRSLKSKSTITIAVSPRDGSVGTIFRLQDPHDPPNHDLASICCQLLRCIIALSRLILTFLVMPFMPALRLCHSIRDWLLQCVHGALTSLSQCARSLATLLKSQIHTRWPVLWRVVECITLMPVQIIQAIIITCEAAPTAPRGTTALRRGPMSSDSQIENVVTITFVKRCLGSAAEYERFDEPLSTLSPFPLCDLDDLPTLEHRSIPSFMGKQLLESCPSPNESPKTGPSQQMKTTTHDHPRAQEMQTFSPRESRDLAVSDPVPVIETSVMAKDVQQSSLDQVQAPEGFPQANIRPIQESTTAQYSNSESQHLFEIPKTYSGDALLADCDVSSVSSDPAHHESFSPEQFQLPSNIRSQPPFDSWTFANSVLRRSHATGLPPPSSPPPPISMEPRSDKPSSVVGSPSSLSAAEESHQVTERPQNFQRLSGVQSACGGSPPQHDDADYSPSETASCCDRPYIPTGRSSERHQSESDECYGTCISCETCDRRHNRAPRRSKIPRRVKTFEHCRPRSSSFTSYHSAQSSGSAKTAIRKKLQKRKVKVY